MNPYEPSRQSPKRASPKTLHDLDRSPTLWFSMIWLATLWIGLSVFAPPPGIQPGRFAWLELLSLLFSTIAALTFVIVPPGKWKFGFGLLAVNVIVLQVLVLQRIP